MIDRPYRICPLTDCFSKFLRTPRGFFHFPMSPDLAEEAEPFRLLRQLIGDILYLMFEPLRSGLSRESNQT